jgi:hypothetical protein
MNRVATIGNVLAADSGPGLTPRQIGAVDRLDVLAALMPSNAGGARQVSRVNVDRNGPEGSRAMLLIRAALLGANDTGARLAVWAVQQRTGSTSAGTSDGTISLLGTISATTGTLAVGSSGGAGQIPSIFSWAKRLTFAPSPEYQAICTAMGRGNPVEIDPLDLAATTPAALILPAAAGVEAVLIEAYSAESGGTANALAVEIGSV